MTKICKQCKSTDIIKAEEGILEHCNECGTIKNQRKAKQLYKEEEEETEQLFNDIVSRR